MVRPALAAIVGGYEVRLASLDAAPTGWLALMGKGARVLGPAPTVHRAEFIRRASVFSTGSCHTLARSAAAASNDRTD